MKSTPFTILLLVLTAVSLHANSRTWTSADGKTLEAEFVSATESEVTIRRESDGRRFTLKLDKLSEDDRAYVKARLSEGSRPDEIEKGPYFSKFTGDWEKMVFAEELPFRLYASKRFKATGSYPLVIYLHGAGQRGVDNESQLGGDVRNFAKPAFYDKREAILVVPQCPSDRNWTGEPGDHVIALIKDLMAKAPVDRNRVYLCGFSLGGYGTWGLLSREPGLFAAGIPVAGGGSPNNGEKLKDIPIWAFHGEKDDSVKVEQSQNLVKAIEDAGGRKVKYTEFKGEGHLISGKVFSDEETHEWLFEQSRTTGD
ncbi:MAG: dienelactone hydrolase family protein [Verrucomicrobiota bacterium]